MSLFSGYKLSGLQKTALHCIEAIAMLMIIVIVIIIIIIIISENHLIASSSSSSSFMMNYQFVSSFIGQFCANSPFLASRGPFLRPLRDSGIEKRIDGPGVFIQKKGARSNPFRVRSARLPELRERERLQ